MMRHGPILRSSCGFLVAVTVLGAELDVAAALRSRRSGTGAATASTATGTQRLPRPLLPPPPPAPPVPAARAPSPAAVAGVAEPKGHVPLMREDQHLFSTIGNKRHYELVPIGAAVFVYGVTCCVVLAAAALMVCCMYDSAAHWCHQARFLSCQSKVQRVHEVFLKKKGEPLMCPYCVEFISGTSRASQPVVFLCGHRFHINCANIWFREHPDKAGRCPLCEDGRDDLKCRSLVPLQAQSCGSRAAARGHGATSPGAIADAPAESGTAAKLQVAAALAACSRKGCCEANISPVESSNDEALSFILGSLHRKYPDIITEECVQRWASCHTEIWLSELHCPRYNSILHKQHK